MTAALEIDELTTGYFGVPVVRGISMEVRPGEVVALLGPNGAGKTSTLLAVSGLLPIMGGRVRVDGMEVVRRRPHRMARRGLAHVPEDRGLFGELTVRENLRLGHGRTAGASERVLEYFPSLQRRIGVRAALLSGGEQQMLAMARAVMSTPKVLLIDEMSLGLAPLVTADLAATVRRIADEQGVAVLLVEQHVQVALRVADRGYVLSHGEMRIQGTAASLSANRALLESSYLGESQAGVHQS
ncbi:ABC transporter related [Parafrankia sp. EAN1pec]|uniref:ABC transporter ATP-binding protein n=1 Tax=Parafrankia sp. (strain EAN1pec) TaxID=298653 RepID=UPI0000540284|nr:ABC transporter related [Frankia sp. EAN1pec]